MVHCAFTAGHVISFEIKVVFFVFLTFMKRGYFKIVFRKKDASCVMEYFPDTRVLKPDFLQIWDKMPASTRIC